MNLGIFQFVGDWSISSVKTFVIKLNNEPDFNIAQNVFIDFRKINFRPEIGDIQELIEFRIKIIPKKHKIAHLVDTPIATVRSHLYLEGLNLAGFKGRYFSTMEQALNFLGLGLTTFEMEIILKNLMYQFE
jgi:hypothetical protein